MIEAIIDYTSTLSEWQIHLLLLTSLFLFVWPRSLFNNAWLIDDQDGVAKYSDRFQAFKQHKDGHVDEEKTITSYKQKTIVDKKDVYTEFKHTQFNPLIEFPASFIRWFRLNVGKRYRIIGKNKKGHDIYGLVQDPVRHHALSLISHFINLVLGYFVISGFWGPQIAFTATAMYTVIPMACQTVAWMSGIAYLWSLSGALLTLLVVQHFSELFITIPLVILTTCISSYTLLAGGHIWAVLLVMGYYPEAAVSLAVFLLIVRKQWPSIVTFRRKAFKEQNMEKSATYNHRRPIIMVKTVWYYIKLLVWPMKLGLFHAWGYHYEEKLERFDRIFICGFLSLCALAVFFFTGPMIVKVGIVWFFVYSATFLNAITAQQFVVDRYVFIPAFGFCLIMAHLFNPYPIVIALIVGLWAMRSIIHIPTFRSEIDFYLSNASTSNFFENEVALGNLGVVYMHAGMPGSACDAWMKAAKINKFYDVAHYNLYSMFKANGMLPQAREHLKHCLNAKTVHFNDHWVKEMKQIDAIITAREGLDLSKLNKTMVEAYK